MSETPPSSSGGPLGKLKGKVKEVAGSLVGDQDLATEGKLEHQAAEVSDDARQRAADAEQAEAKAEVEGALQANTVETARLEAERAEAESSAQIDRERAQAEARAEAVHEQRESQVEQQADRERQAAARDAVDALGDRAEAEQEAARLEAQAQAARNTADLVDPDPNH